MEIKHDDWYGLYSDRWDSSELTKEAYSHPAKFARGLIQKIYQHAMEEGWIGAKSRIVDCFGGVALGGFFALAYDMTWVGVELEQHHVDHGAGCECTGVTEEDWAAHKSDLETIRFADGRHICPECIRRSKEPEPAATQISMFTVNTNGYHFPPHRYIGNIELWRSKGLKLGSATLLQGDSRKLREVLRNKLSADIEISSPPYASQEKGYGDRPNRWGKVKDNPNFAGRTHWADNDRPNEYGNSEGQLESMPEGDVQAVISSPPFTGVTADQGWQMLGRYAEQGKLTVKQVNGDPNKLYPSWSPDRDTSYGTAPGQLSEMPEGEAPDPEDVKRAIEVLKNDPGFHLVATSPPFIAQSGGTNVTSKEGPLADGRLLDRHSAGNSAAHGYGDGEQNLANLPGEGFTAALASPQFADSLSRDRVDPDGRRALARSQGISNAEFISPIDMENIGERSQQSGATPGNLGGMGDEGYAASIASPPFAQVGVPDHKGQTDALKGVFKGGGDGFLHKEYGETSGNLGNMPGEGFADSIISSPPYAEISQSGGTEGLKEHGTGLTGGERCFSEYGEQEGQLGRMKNEGYDQILSSPPYAEARIGQESGQEQCGHHDAYSENEGQLGAMKGDGYSAAVSSPPFEAVTSDRPSASIVEGGLRMGASSMGDGYGETEGQLGSDSGETFWSAARKILEELYMVLRPGGHAIFVVKSYVKGGAIVPFPEQWMKLCEVVGFVPLHWHRAWVVEDKGTQLTLEGEAIKKQTSRKSFFRRLYENKHPENAIDYECVICLMKPE